MDVLQQIAPLVGIGLIGVRQTLNGAAELRDVLLVKVARRLLSGHGFRTHTKGSRGQREVVTEYL